MLQLRHVNIEDLCNVIRQLLLLCNDSTKKVESYSVKKILGNATDSNGKSFRHCGISRSAFSKGATTQDRNLCHVVSFTCLQKKKRKADPLQSETTTVSASHSRRAIPDSQRRKTGVSPSSPHSVHNIESEVVYHLTCPDFGSRSMTNSPSRIVSVNGSSRRSQ